jgi:hypothetical protein
MPSAIVMALGFCTMICGPLLAFCRYDNEFFFEVAVKGGVVIWALGCVWMMVVALKIAFRPKAGHCCRCGYDLRASSDRCPECGSAVTPNDVSA